MPNSRYNPLALDQNRGELEPLSYDQRRSHARGSLGVGFIQLRRQQSPLASGRGTGRPDWRCWKFTVRGNSLPLRQATFDRKIRYPWLRAPIDRVQITRI